MKIIIRTKLPRKKKKRYKKALAKTSIAELILWADELVESTRLYQKRNKEQNE